jgi:DNA mismatch endonuclease (patch repair protein)
MQTALRKLLPSGSFGDVSPTRSATMRAVRSFGNRTTEVRLRMGLVRSGIRGWRTRPVRTMGNPDFIFTEAKLAVFADGCFWHGCTHCPHGPIKSNSAYWGQKILHNQQKDARVTEQLRSNGWRVLRFWEHEIQGSLSIVVARIRSDISSTNQTREISKEPAPSTSVLGL